MPLEIPSQTYIGENRLQGRYQLTTPSNRAHKVSKQMDFVGECDKSEAKERLLMTGQIQVLR